MKRDIANICYGVLIGVTVTLIACCVYVNGAMLVRELWYTDQLNAAAVECDEGQL